MSKLGILFFAAYLLAAPANAQDMLAYPTTNAFVARGSNVEMLEQVFREMGTEAVGSANDIRLSLFRLPNGRGSIHVYRFRYAGPTAVSAAVEHYHAAIVNGTPQALERVEDDDVLTNSDGSQPTLVQGQVTSLDVTGAVLFELELAHASQPSGYDAPPLKDTIVSYTEVNSGTREAPMTYARIVFLDPSRRGRDFTVYTHNGVISRTFEGIPSSDDWLNSARWLNQR